MDANYRPNSNKYKKELTEGSAESRVQKVVSGTVKTRKKSELRKLGDVFISEDATKVKDFIFMDVLVPAIKKAVSDIVVNGIDMILYGETNRSRGQSSPTNTIRYTNYNSISSGRDTRARTSRTTYSYDDLSYQNRGSAEAVLMGLEDLIRTYKVARVADLYELSGQYPIHTDYKYGWYDLSMADVVSYRNGEYGLRLPRALPIDD